MSRRTRQPVQELYGAAALQANRPRPADPEAALAEILREMGVDEDTAAEVDAIVDAFVIHRMSEVIVRLAQALPVTADGMALRRVLLGEQAPTLRTAAETCGCSWMKLWRKERSIRKALSVTAAP